MSSPIEPKEIWKYAGESFFIGGSIAKVAEDGETITSDSSSVVATDKQGNTSTIVDSETLAVTEAGQVLKARVSGGEASLSPYIITFYMVTSKNNTWAVRFELTVV